jgi:60 kDa SS-A/Ro ribonucleoprotein
MKTNKKTVAQTKTTHEGGRASRITALQELKRSVMSCLLFEDQFYENGVDNATRIKNLVAKVDPQDAVAVAISARNDMHLRHAPLWIAVAMCRTGGEHRKLVGKLLPIIIQRPDELGEFLSMYWKEGRVPLAKQVKIGLGEAFKKFNEYQLGKYLHK